MIKKSEIINKIHIVVYLYLVFGWLFSLTSCKILLFFSPTVMAQWGINNDRCILTQLEEKYRKEELLNIKILKKDDDKMVIKDEKDEKDEKEDKDKEENISFTRNMFKKFGIDITERGTTILTYMVAYHSFLQSYWRVVF
tara:strand:- start:218 stop:637 length:420 start_codon:yes stop_codon:yes gene_type:complete